MNRPAPSDAATVHKGLEGVVASETRISDVDGARCQLSYRGYVIDELVGRASYEEVSFLLLRGRLPTRQELSEWTEELVSRRPLDPELLRLMPLIPQANSMAFLRTIISAMGLLDARAEDASPDARLDQAKDLIAKIPTIVATFERLHRQQPMLGPRPDLGHAANFLYMLHGDVPSPQHAAALDAYFVLLAEHGFNASTFAARCAIGTQSDCYSALTCAIATLKGPLHGAANAKAMEMLLEIGSPEQAEPYVRKAMTDHRRFMGFGHRVYKGEDPRAKHLKRIAGELAQASREPKWFEISERLQQVVWQAKQLSINVDFYSASLLYYLGIPVDLFTPMFACARMAGWCAHVLEQYADNRLIRPLALYVGLRDLRFVPVEARVSPAESRPPAAAR